MFNILERNIAVIGLGYVGLPLAVEFSKKYKVLGFDTNQSRIDQLSSGVDFTLEVSDQELKAASHLQFSADKNDLKDYDVFIVTVPTPIDKYKQPDLSPLIQASEMLGSIIKEGDIIIYESTVYPGATEHDCIPVVERVSGLKLNENFYAGYSPERINPGDKEHRLVNILKVTSGSNEDVAQFVDSLYSSIITAGTYKASSIKVAEAAKVIENTQRDVNIALINELSIIFNKLEIDTQEVLEAAGTKWNFLPFRPGLVGGHCIGVDPYYLTYKAIEAGYNPEIILAGRRINDNMGLYISNQIIKLMNKNQMEVIDARVLIMGLSFKENCPDIRNTRVKDILNELRDFSCNVDIYDPIVSQVEPKLLETDLIKTPEKGKYDVIVMAVAHSLFKKMGVERIKTFGKKKHILYDVKNVFKSEEVDGRL